MAIVINHAPKWAEALTAGGQGLMKGIHAKDQHDAYRAQVARATQELAQDAARERRAQEDQEFERAQQKALQLSRERGIVLQDQAIERGSLELDDMKAGGSADPFTVALSDPNLGPAPKAQLARDQGIYQKMHGTTYAKRFATESLTSAKQLQSQHQSEQMRSHITDQLALGAYGEDESGQKGAEGLLKLLDSGATAEEVARKDMELRMSMARSADKRMEMEQALAYADTVLGAIQPGTPGADKARRARAAAQHGLVTPQKMYEELEVAQRPETQTGGPKQLSKIEIRKSAHDMAVKEAHALGVTKHDEFQQLMDKNMTLLMQDQLDSSPQALDPMEPLRSRSQNSGQPSTQAGPAAGAPPGSPTSGTPGGAAAPSKPVDQATAIRAAQEAVKHGATDDELRQILEAAGIDPDSPASVAPFQDKGSSVTDAPTKKSRIRRKTGNVAEEGIQPGRP